MRVPPDLDSQPFTAVANRHNARRAVQSLAQVGARVAFHEVATSGSLDTRTVPSQDGVEVRLTGCFFCSVPAKKTLVILEARVQLLEMYIRVWQHEWNDGHYWHISWSPTVHSQIQLASVVTAFFSILLWREIILHRMITRECVFLFLTRSRKLFYVT